MMAETSINPTRFSFRLRSVAPVAVSGWWSDMAYFVPLFVSVRSGDDYRGSAEGLRVTESRYACWGRAVRHDVGTSPRRPRDGIVARAFDVLPGPGVGSGDSLLSSGITCRRFSSSLGRPTVPAVHAVRRAADAWRIGGDLPERHRRAGDRAGLRRRVTRTRTGLRRVARNGDAARNNPGAYVQTPRRTIGRRRIRLWPLLPAEMPVVRVGGVEGSCTGCGNGRELAGGVVRR